jgi:hypothetical protein
VEIPAWDAHTDEQQRLMARQAENYADSLEHTDFEVGRLVDALEGMGELENTLVLYLIGDNGSSGEGTLTGSLNEMLEINGYLPTFEQLLPRLDEIGLPGTAPHYAVGWAWAGDTPFRWTKQIASHFGGTRNGLFVSWPVRNSGAEYHRLRHHQPEDQHGCLARAAAGGRPRAAARRADPQQDGRRRQQTRQRVAPEPRPPGGPVGTPRERPHGRPHRRPEHDGGGDAGRVAAHVPQAGEAGRRGDEAAH